MKETKTPEEIQSELNSWLEKVNNFGSVRKFYELEESVQAASNLIDNKIIKCAMYPEDYDVAGIGTKADCDKFFTKFNDSVEYLEDILVLKKYLTDTELKERLQPDVYINLETDKVADKYLIHVKNKELKNLIQQKQLEIEALKTEIKRNQKS